MKLGGAAVFLTAVFSITNECWVLGPYQSVRSLPPQLRGKRVRDPEEHLKLPRINVT